MAITIQTKNGKIQINNDVVASITGGATMKSAGVISMSAKNLFRDYSSTVLRKQNYARGVLVSTKDDQLIIEIHLIARLGTRLSEVTKSVKQNVEYQIKNQLGLSVDEIKVIVDEAK